MGNAVWKVAVPAAMMLFATLMGFPRQAEGEDGFPLAAAELRQVLSRDAAGLETGVDGSRVLLHDGVAEFYRERQFLPVWLEDQYLNKQALALLIALRQAAVEGLNPEDYQVSTLTASAEQKRFLPSYGKTWDGQGLARLDILLTNAFLRYAGHLSRGRVEPGAVYLLEWRTAPKQVDVVKVLNDALEQGRIAEALAELAPGSSLYVQLRDYLALYRQLAAEGGWPQIPDGRTVRPDEEDWRIPWLRRHLVRVGDLDESLVVGAPVLDPETAAALQRFQSRHGLTGDGVFGPQTLAELNVSVEERIRQIEINMERSRWLTGDPGDHYIMVNIADFTLTVVEKGEPVLNMAVVVGTPFRRTPVFSTRLSYLVFSPFWNVPVSILRQDKLPLIKSDINYLAAHHYQIVAWKDFPNRLLDPANLDWEGISAENFPGLLRQEPGPWNALGRVKFMLPDSFNIYLHDSPDRHLFERKTRVFSSGCIRIERPLDLAAYLLRNREDWDEKRIWRAMTAGKPQRVDLQEHLPVHILYRTAWVDGQGRLQFRRDIYGRDRDLYAALEGAPAPAKAMLASDVRRSSN
jgi:murein L,D-transpeptidase YcbB/YkuD